MPKTRDAFALRTLSKKLEKNVGAYNLPNGNNRDLLFKSIPVLHWWAESKGIYNYSYEQEITFKKSEVALDYLFKMDKQLNEDCNKIEKHLLRLRKILFAFSKKNPRSSVNLWRVQFLLSQYEWFRTFFAFFVSASCSDMEIYEKHLPDEYNNYFASRLKEARMLKKMKQSEIAEKLKITPAAYSNYERGARDLPMYTIYRLTQILDVSADYLFGIKK